MDILSGLTYALHFVGTHRTPGAMGILCLAVLLWLLWRGVPNWLRALIPSSDEVAVTQFVSCLFYGSAFAASLWHHNGTFFDPAVGGFGWLDRKVFQNMESPQAKMLFTLFVMLGIVAGNAWRYYLSFWYVEESRAFRDLRKKLWWLPRYTEWTLRFLSLVFLYLVQATFLNSGKGVELLLATVFLLLCSWDILLFHTCSTFLANGTFTVQDLGDFMRRLWWWCILEGIGFILSTGYVVLAYWPIFGNETLRMLLVCLSTLFLALGLVDGIINRDKYVPLLIPVVAGTAGVFIATRLLSRLG